MTDEPLLGIGLRCPCMRTMSNPSQLTEPASGNATQFSRECANRLSGFLFGYDSMTLPESGSRDPCRVAAPCLIKPCRLHAMVMVAALGYLKHRDAGPERPYA